MEDEELSVLDIARWLTFATFSAASTRCSPTGPRAVAIAEAARRLVELRDRWFNPPEWVEWVNESVPGYPARPVARDDAAAKELKARRPTNLYNVRPQWLTNVHAALDTAVAATYGWDAGI